jgi:hypothetical protein
MTVDTDWQPGAKVTLALTGQWRLTGAVLAAERPPGCPTPSTTHPSSPSVYVTLQEQPEVAALVAQAASFTVPDGSGSSA